MATAAAGVRRRALLLAGALSLLLGLGIALADAQGEAGRPEHPAEQLLLRLHDLPLGFVPFSRGSGSESICGPLRPAEPPRKVAAFIDRFSPKGCWSVFSRLYEVPGVASPSMAGTGALDAGSAAGAAAGYAVAPQILADFTEDGTRAAPTPETVGEATRLFHWRDLPALTPEEDQRGTFVIWRSGDVVAATFAAADSLAAADRFALDLARRQQAHIENPTPYTAAERYATEVPLENPQLEVPVYWLGRTFSPGHGLRDARLLEASARIGLSDEMFHLEYTRGIYLDGWTEDDWSARDDAMPRWGWRCTRSRKLALPQGGHAVIYASYLRNLSECPGRPPRLYSALVHIGGAVLVIGRLTCAACLGNTTAGGEYGSPKGIRAVLSGLQLRPKPAG
jgi:hypothetical protein